MVGKTDQSGRFADSAMDALPMRIAVIDRDGTIRHTNRPWREYAASNGIDDPAMIGVDYLAASKEADQAVNEGIRGVLDAETDVFTYEYPCETPTEMRWFLMRVAPFIEDGTRYAALAHIDITERKRQEQKREALLSRVRGLVTEAASTIASADDEQAILTGLPEIVVDAGPYTSAWSFQHDIRTDSLTRAYVAGRANPNDITDIPLEDANTTNPAARAFETMEPEVLAPGAASHIDERDTRAPRFGSTFTLLLPIHYQGTRYGLLGVEGPTDSISPDIERETLAAVARIAGQTLYDLEHRQMLHGTREFALEYTGPLEPDPIFEVAADIEARISLKEVLPSGDNRSYVLQVDETGVDSFRLAAEAHDSIRTVGLLGAPERGLIEVTVDGGILDRISTEPVAIETFTVGPNSGTLRMAVPTERRARALHEGVLSDCPGLELREKQERDRPTDRTAEFVEPVLESLTDRQAAALLKSFRGGYFESPRGTDGDELADSMGITRQTFHQHLQSAQQKVFERILEDSETTTHGVTSD